MSETQTTDAHSPIGLLQQGRAETVAPRCAPTCQQAIQKVDVIEALDETYLSTLAFLLIDNAGELDSRAAESMVKEYAPTPLIGLLDTNDYCTIDRLTRAGFTFAITPPMLDTDVLHVMALSAGHAAARIKDYAHAMSKGAVLQDRQRTARDLHDQVIQQLFCLGMDIERLLTPNVELRDQARELAGRLDDAIDDLRHAVGALRSGTTPLVAQRLGRIVDDARELSGREVDYVLEGDVDDVNADIQVALVAVMREALSNAVKYGSGRIDVAVTVRHSLNLTVKTAARVVGDGETPVSKKSNSGFGLSNMKSRAVAHGGGSELVTLVDGSTVLRWSVPLGPRGGRSETGTFVPAA